MFHVTHNDISLLYRLLQLVLLVSVVNDDALGGHHPAVGAAAEGAGHVAVAASDLEQKGKTEMNQRGGSFRSILANHAIRSPLSLY